MPESRLSTAQPRKRHVLFSGSRDATVEHLAMLCRAAGEDRGTRVCRDAARRHLLPVR